MEERTTRRRVRDDFESLADADGDLGEILDLLPPLLETLADVAAPDFECAMVPMPPTRELVYPGIEGMRRAWRDWNDPYRSLRAELEGIRESDTHLVALVRQLAITNVGEVKIEKPSAMAWVFAGDRVTRIEMHLDRRLALERAGLGPQSSQA